DQASAAAGLVLGDDRCHTLLELLVRPLEAVPFAAGELFGAFDATHLARGLRVALAEFGSPGFGAEVQIAVRYGCRALSGGVGGSGSGSSSKSCEPQSGCHDRGVPHRNSPLCRSHHGAARDCFGGSVMQGQSTPLPADFAVVSIGIGERPTSDSCF